MRHILPFIANQLSRRINVCDVVCVCKICLLAIGLRITLSSFAPIELYLLNYNFVNVDRYLRSVSILTFMNKIDKLREKVEKGDDFSAAIDRVRKQAAELSQSADVKSDFERGLYSHIHQILVENPYSTFIPTG